jgi:hypothetical protein
MEVEPGLSLRHLGAMIGSGVFEVQIEKGFGAEYEARGSNRDQVQSTEVSIEFEF